MAPATTAKPGIYPYKPPKRSGNAVFRALQVREDSVSTRNNMLLDFIQELGTELNQREF